MTRQIWFLRHGEAEPHGTRPDDERRLTERGKEQSRAAGVALAALEVGFAGVFTSPKVRSHDTARLAGDVLDQEPIVHEPLAAGFDRAEAIALIGGYDADARILVVGHEPDFSQTIHDLTGADIGVKKGGVVAVRLSGSALGELVVALRPRELALIAASRR